METTCPNCAQSIEIDTETLAALQGTSHFNCPTCAEAVPVPGHSALLPVTPQEKSDLLAAASNTLETTCPHCSQGIEMDEATMEVLRGMSHVECPACGGAVPVPGFSAFPSALPPATQLQPPAPVSQIPKGLVSTTLESTWLGLNRNLVILGALALLTLGGLGIYLVIRKAGTTQNTKKDTVNETIHNKFFTDLIASGATTEKDLLASLADIQPQGIGFIGVSKEKFTPAQASDLAKRTGSKFLALDEPGAASRKPLLEWLATTYPDLRGSTTWIMDGGEAKVIDSSDVNRVTTMNRPRRVFLNWRPKITSRESTPSNIPAQTSTMTLSPLPTWSFAGGKGSFQSHFGGLEGDKVKLITGVVETIPLTKLSPESQEQARTLAAATLSKIPIWHFGASHAYESGVNGRPDKTTVPYAINQWKNLIHRDGTLYLAGEAFRFENHLTGQKAMVSLGTPLDRSQFTIFVRLNPETMDKWQTVACFGPDWRWFHLHAKGDGPITASLATKGGQGVESITVKGNLPLKAGKWSVVGCSVDLRSKKVAFYLDGQAIGTGDLPPDFQWLELDGAPKEESNTIVFTHSGRGGPRTNTFRGWVSDIWIFQEALSAPEVSALKLSASTGANTQAALPKLPDNEGGKRLWRLNTGWITPSIPGAKPGDQDREFSTVIQTWTDTNGVATNATFVCVDDRDVIVRLADNSEKRFTTGELSTESVAMARALANTPEGKAAALRFQEWKNLPADRRTIDKDGHRSNDPI